MAKNNIIPVVAQTLKISLPFLIFISLAAAIWYGVQALQNPNILPIKSVSISADAKNISADTLKDLVAQNVRGGFFSLDTEQLSAALMNLPWVKRVDIQRVWPDRLKIKIIERRAVALWGKDGAIDQDGDAFFPPADTLPANLPVLIGPGDHVADVVHLYNSLSSFVAPSSMAITNLVLSDRGAWQLQLGNGLEVILGTQDIAQRFQRFITLYPKIIGANSDKASSVDLRYPNGIAVRWKDAYKP